MPIKEIKYTNDAFASLFSLVNFIEDKNTINAGLRWLNRYESFLIKNLSNSLAVKICTNKTFQQLRIFCLNYNDWLIAYSIHTDHFLIEAILHKSRIVD